MRSSPLWDVTQRTLTVTDVAGQRFVPMFLGEAIQGKILIGLLNP